MSIVFNMSSSKPSPSGFQETWGILKGISIPIPVTQLEYRSSTRVIALIHFGSSAIGLLIFIAAIIFMVFASDSDLKDEWYEVKGYLNLNDSQISDEEWSISTLKVVMCGIIIVGIALHGIGLLTAVQLFKSSKRGANPVTAIGQARLWLHVNVTLLILSLFLAMSTLRLLFMVIVVLSVAVNGITFYFVVLYIRELDGLILQTTEERELWGCSTIEGSLA